MDDGVVDKKKVEEKCSLRSFEVLFKLRQARSLLDNVVGTKQPLNSKQVRLSQAEVRKERRTHNCQNFILPTLPETP